MALTLQLERLIGDGVRGELLVASEPLSFWGGYDYESGTIIDMRHPLANVVAAGKILAIPFTRGSSSTTSVLLEAVKAGTAPAAIISSERDTFFMLAAVVAEQLYGRPLPLFVVDEAAFASLQSGDVVAIDAAGRLTAE